VFLRSSSFFSEVFETVSHCESLIGPRVDSSHPRPPPPPPLAIESTCSWELKMHTQTNLARSKSKMQVYCVLILDFHREMNTDFWFWGFCTVCKVNFLATFREPLWSHLQWWYAHTHSTPIQGGILLRYSFTLQPMTIEDGTHRGSRNVVKKFTLHTVQNPQNQKSSILWFYIVATDKYGSCLTVVKPDVGDTELMLNYGKYSPFNTVSRGRIRVFINTDVRYSKRPHILKSALQNYFNSLLQKYMPRK
jgi:hypothetical protein